MKRFRILSLLILLLAIWMTSAIFGEAAQPNIPETAAITAPAPTDDLALVTGGKANFTIVRSESADEDTLEKVDLLRKNIETYTGVRLAVSTDWIKEGDAYDPNTLEILVGQTNYPESVEVMQKLPYGNYIITRSGNKLVVTAWTDKALDRAVTNLLTLIKRNTVNGDCILPHNVRLTGVVERKLNAIPHYENATLSSIYPSSNENFLLLFDDTDMAEYCAYLTALEDKGFTLYTQNEVKKNRFDTYLNERYILSAGYYGSTEQVRLVIEPRGNLPPREEENEYTKVTQPKFAMLGLEYADGGDTAPQNGQCLIWQLADGSFLVVDGGFNRASDAKRIYTFMKEHAPDPNNITIAAWIITHAHGDHYAAFSQFSYLYCKEVDLELLIANFISDEGRTAGGLDKSEGSGYVHVLKYEKQYRDCKFVTAHVGQKFYLRDAVVEMLYTIESFVPRPLDYFNTTSLVFTVDIASQRFLITGDASNDACRIIDWMYGDYLKSDFLQTPHHGYGTGPNSVYTVMKMYSYAQAPVILWPVGTKDFAPMNSRAYNAHLLKLASTKEIFVAGSRQVVLPLPYTPGTSRYDSILK